MNITFDTETLWNDRGGLLGWMTVDGRDVRFFVSREFISDKFGGDGSKENVTRAFDENRAAIEDLLKAQVAGGGEQPVEGERFSEVVLLSRRASA